MKIYSVRIITFILYHILFYRKLDLSSHTSPFKLSNHFEENHDNTLHDSTWNGSSLLAISQANSMDPAYKSLKMDSRSFVGHIMQTPKDQSVMIESPPTYMNRPEASDSVKYYVLETAAQ